MYCILNTILCLGFVITLSLVPVLLIVGKRRKWRKPIYGSVVALLCVGVLVLLACLFGPLSNPANNKTIGTISTPVGYQRIKCKKGSMGDYLRRLPLKRTGTLVHLYSGKLARFQFLSYAVIDQNILSNGEQCADVCMRLRAEYLFEQGKYNSIVFTALNGTIMRYQGGNNRKAFERFMRDVYGVCNTTSLHSSLKSKPLSDVAPGDIFVYPHHGKHYGHAVIVADVAVNSKGQKAILLVEGNTPAREKHVLRNPFNPLASPWMFLNEDASQVRLSVFSFTNRQLKKW